MTGNNLRQAENDNGDGGIFLGLFLLPEIKYCLTLNEYRVINERNN